MAVCIVAGAFHLSLAASTFTLGWTHSIEYLVSLKLIAPAAAPVLREIRLHNPLLFDFVLKRSLDSNGTRFAPRVFRTRGFFEGRV